MKRNTYVLSHLFKSMKNKLTLRSLGPIVPLARKSSIRKASWRSSLIDFSSRIINTSFVLEPDTIFQKRKKICLQVEGVKQTVKSVIELCTLLQRMSIIVHSKMLTRLFFESTSILHCSAKMASPDISFSESTMISFKQYISGVEVDVILLGSCACVFEPLETQSHNLCVMIVLQGLCSDHSVGILAWAKSRIQVYQFSTTNCYGSTSLSETDK